MDDFDMTNGQDERDERPLLSDVPLKDLASLDTTYELMVQYQRAETLARDVLTDPDVPANQKAQVLTSVKSVLAEIIKLQTELSNSEEFKRIEQALATVLKRYPDIQAAFMEELKAAVQ